MNDAVELGALADEELRVGRQRGVEGRRTGLGRTDQEEVGEGHARLRSGRRAVALSFHVGRSAVKDRNRC